MCAVWSDLNRTCMCVQIGIFMSQRCHFIEMSLNNILPLPYKTIIGPFKVDERVKLKCTNYWNLMDETFFAWYKSQSCKVKCVFILDSVHSHVSKLTHKLFKHKRFTREKIMEWSSSSPDLNLIENMWPVVKMKSYESG